MKLDSRFQARPETGFEVTLTLDGKKVPARVGDSVAAAILAHTGDPFRTTSGQAPRAAFCMMGACFECLVEIDGKANSQSCMTPVQDGMEIKTQNGLRTMGPDAND